MPEVTALRLGKQLEVLQPKNMPFTKLPRNECMITVSGGGKTNAHIQTLTQPWGLAGRFDKYTIMSLMHSRTLIIKYSPDHRELNSTHRFFWVPCRICEE